MWRRTTIGPLAAGCLYSGKKVWRSMIGLSQTWLLAFSGAFAAPFAISTLLTWLMIHQSDLEFLQPGQPVHLFLRSLPGRPFQTRLEYVSRRSLQVSPKSLSTKAGGSLMTATDPLGRERPAEATYQASTERLELPSTVVPGTTGSAKVHVGRTPLIYRLWRLAHRTFRISSL